jgi:hypothetical protein
MPGLAVGHVMKSHVNAAADRPGPLRRQAYDAARVRRHHSIQIGTRRLGL